MNTETQELAQAIVGAFKDANKPSKEKQPKKQVLIPSMGWNNGCEITEVCYNAKSKKAYFIRYNNVIGSFDTLASINELIPPIEDETITKEVILLPDAVEDYGTQEQLVEDIIAFIHKYTDVEPWFERLSAYYVLLTWMHDKLMTLNYMKVRGDKGTGKSRYLDTMTICYRTFKCTDATASNIYRIMEQFHGTILFEEFIPTKSNDAIDIVKILNAGFQKGNKVPRSNGDKNYTLRFFDPYGPKILATREDLTSLAFESRCVTQTTVETDRDDIPTILIEAFYEEQRHLRNKLLKWRLENWHTFNLDKAMIAEKRLFKGISGRTKQVYLPFLYFIDGTDYETEFMEIVRREEEEQKISGYESSEGKVVNAWVEVFIKQGYVTVNNISTKIRSTAEEVGNTYSDYFKPHFCAKILKELKFSTKQSKAEGKTQRVLFVEARQLNKLVDKYTESPVKLHDAIKARRKKGGTQGILQERKRVLV